MYTTWQGCEKGGAHICERSTDATHGRVGSDTLASGVCTVASPGYAALRSSERIVMRLGSWPEQEEKNIQDGQQDGWLQRRISTGGDPNKTHKRLLPCFRGSGFTYREKDKVNSVRQKNHCLLPHYAPLFVPHVMDLVKDHPPYFSHDLGPAIHHRPQNLKSQHGRPQCEQAFRCASVAHGGCTDRW